MVGPGTGEEFELDAQLLEGFGFACRPDCGLCCYASPSVAPGERGPLEARHPELAPIFGPPGWTELPQQGAGGACRLLAERRCRGHAVRPFPCRLFPLHAYLGARAQLSVVLSCPGLTMSRLTQEGPGGATDGRRTGLETERAAFDARWTQPDVRDLCAAARSDRSRLFRRAARRAGFEDPDRIRPRLTAAPPLFEGDASEWASRPERADGLDQLPLAWFAPSTVIGIAAEGDETDLLVLRPEGGTGGSIGRFATDPAGTRPSRSARGVLARYLAYVAGRDAFSDAVTADWVRRDGEETLEEAFTEELRRVGATVLLRAQVLRRARGVAEPEIDVAALVDGIRATDAEILDRDVPGRVL